MLAPLNSGSTFPVIRTSSPLGCSRSTKTSGFALISVLALISLAALSATAFLASARLERRATMPLSQSTQLEMALSAGANAAREMLDYAPSKQFNFVTTYWRGTNISDWTNELGYLLSGAVQSTSARTSTIYNFYACFSTATMTNLGTSANDTINVSNNVTNQGTFTSQIASFMRAMTNFPTNKVSGLLESTSIPLLGDTPAIRYTSPPVGWVYITQDRVVAGKTISNLPVARFAFFTQDTCGLIDAERMGGLTNGSSYRAFTNFPTNYTPGTNPAEIALSFLTNTALSNASAIQSFVSTNNRTKYLTPGFLTFPSAGNLNTNDLRYFTTGLRHWTNAWERIPAGLGYRNAWTNKFSLANVDSNSLSNIVAVLNSNVPDFTNRAGGMNGSVYLHALAANMIDYADTDSSATYTNLGTDINPTNIIGFDNYPVITQLFDQIIYSNGTNANLQIVTYFQLWNPSSLDTPSYEGKALKYSFNHAVTYTNTNNGSTTNVSLNTSSLLNSNFSMTNSIQPNSVYVSAITNTISLTNTNIFPGFPTNANIIALRTAYNTFSLILSNSSSYVSNRPAMAFTATPDSLTNSRTNFNGTILSAAVDQTPYSSTAEPNTIWNCDPRMLPYRGLGLNGFAHANVAYSRAFWYGYPRRAEQINGTITSPPILGHPALWMDGPSFQNTTIPGRIPGTNSPPQPPELGIPNATNNPVTSENAKPVCKVSNRGGYQSVAELGNIFDPMQWTPPSTFPNNNNSFTNADITTQWSTNALYGGGSTLRIGRPEHSRFAFTNLPNSTVGTPNMQQSAAALLDLFCSASSLDESGQINLNTAPAPVLRALAGDILLTRDGNLVPTSGNPVTSYAVPPAMAEAFAQGVMRFRQRYPFYSPSQLCFISPSISWPGDWPNSAVFGSLNSIPLTISVPGNAFGSSTSIGLRAWSDEAAEEWFSKIYKLSTTQTRNFRVYVVAQLVNSNKIGVGPAVRKYYNVCTRQNSDKQTDVPPASASTFELYSAPY